MSTEGIFLALGEDGYEYCHPINPDDFVTINREINGEEKIVGWLPVPVELVQREGSRHLLRSDSPWLGDNALIFRPEVILGMGDVLGKAGELLPLVCRDARLCVFNPRHALPALDESASSLIRFEDGRVMMVQKYAFIPHILRGIDAFKLTNLRVSPTFITKRIVDAWHDRGFKGLKFRQVA